MRPLPIRWDANNPHPPIEQESQFLESLTNSMSNSIRAIENLPADKRSTIDQKDICKFKYYQSLMKRHEKPEDYSRYSHIFHTEPKEKVFCPPHRRVRVEKSKIKITVEDKNHSFSVRDNEIGRKITSEFIQACLLGLHTQKNSEITDLYKDIAKTLGDRKFFFAALSSPHTRWHYRNKFGEFNYNHERQTLAQTQEQKFDFERLCKNHTVEQYEREISRDVLKQNVLKSQRITIRSSKHTEVFYHNDKQSYAQGYMHPKSHPVFIGRGRFNTVRMNRQPRKARLHNIAASQKSFMPSKEDQQKALKRKNDERLNRGGKRSYLSQALD